MSDGNIVSTGNKSSKNAVVDEQLVLHQGLIVLFEFDREIGKERGDRVSVAQSDESRTLPYSPRFYGNRLRKTSEIKGDDVVETWRYEIFALDTLHYSLPIPKGADAYTYLLEYIASLLDDHPAELPEGLEYFVFTCDSKDNKDMGTRQLVEALNRFTVDHQD